MKEFILNNGRRVEIQDFLQSLSDGVPGLSLGVVTVPHSDDILILPAGHSHTYKLRRPEVLTDHVEQQLFPQDIYKVVLMANLHDPAAPIRECLPCGLQIGPEDVQCVPIVFSKLRRVLQMRIVSPKAFDGAESAYVNKVVQVLLHTSVLSIRGRSALGFI